MSPLEPPFAAADERTESPRERRDHLPFGYLRGFLVLLVLAHHAVLAYHPHAPAPLASLVDEPRWWQAFPVLDAQRFELVALFAGWNDIFLMALLFFVSGLFVPASLDRHGAGPFLGRRLRRLGLPFLALAAVVAPLAYYPAYLATAAPAGIGGFARQWLALGNWPTGPGWFLWLLLAFDAVAAGLFRLRAKGAASLARRLAAVAARPALFFALLATASALAYLPLVRLFGPLHWTAVGPFSFQTSRLLHYAVYFFAGVVLGAGGPDRGLLAAGGRLARRWGLWIGAAPGAYALAIAAYLATLAEGAGTATRTLASLGFVVTCAVTSLALLAVFLRFARAPVPLLDGLRANAYGMYVVHYAPASWLQLALLEVALPAPLKATAAVLATVASSWALAAALRRLPAVRRVL